MKVMIICGVFAEENEQEILEHAKRPVEFSANVFQTKLIRGFQQANIDTQVLSAPFIGSFPNASDVMAFSGFTRQQSQYIYVHFNNCWGIRNFSRAISLKKNLNAFITDMDPQKIIVVYSAHTPFLEAAVYAKRKDPNIKICMVIPDLPQYMNLDTRISALYKVGKQWDVARFNRLSVYVDSFVLLTEAMKDKLKVGLRPYTVVEGIVDSDIFERNEKAKHALVSQGTDERYIVYTGKTNERFGVKKLVDAFAEMQDPMLRLVLCGKGDCDDYIAQAAKTDVRILAQGQVPHDKALEWILRADVLVNPRENNEEYTKYSFPSKTIEYLASGNPVVGYLLDGMPSVYADLLISVGRDGLAQAIHRALNTCVEERAVRNARSKAHLASLTAKSVVEAILHMTYYAKEER